MGDDDRAGGGTLCICLSTGSKLNRCWTTLFLKNSIEGLCFEESVVDAAGVRCTGLQPYILMYLWCYLRSTLCRMCHCQTEAVPQDGPLIWWHGLIAGLMEKELLNSKRFPRFTENHLHSTSDIWNGGHIWPIGQMWPRFWQTFASP